MTATKPFARSRSRRRATASSRPKNRSASSWPKHETGIRAARRIGRRCDTVGNNGCHIVDTFEAAQPCGPSSGVRRPSAGSDRGILQGRSRARSRRSGRDRGRARRGSPSDPVRRRRPRRLRRLRGRPALELPQRSRGCVASRSPPAPLPAFGNAETVASPSTVAPTRRPPCASTARSITSCISTSAAGTRCGAFPQLRRADDIGEQHGRDSRRSFVAPAGAVSRSTSSPGVAGRRRDRSQANRASLLPNGWLCRARCRSTWAPPSRRFTGQQARRPSPPS